MSTMTPTCFSERGAQAKLLQGNWKRRFDVASEDELNLHLVAQIRRKLANKRAREEARRILQQPVRTPPQTSSAEEKT